MNKALIRVAIFSKNNSNSYSGGRIHALSMAYGLAANGYKVDFYTNAKPIFFGEFDQYPGSNNLHLKVNRFFLFLNAATYDLIVVIPHLASKKSFIVDRFLFYPIVKKFKSKSKCPLWYLDFESPNWINEMLPGARPVSLYKYSDQILLSADAIISTTKTGLEYAKLYYSKMNNDLKYHQLYLAINSAIADNTAGVVKEDQVIFFGRFSEKHKNPDVIIDIITSLPSDYQLVIIGEKSKVPDYLLQQITAASAKQKIRVDFLSGITEERKYNELAKSKLLIYSSGFEGYGLPPVEAQYVGTPVLCSDIPVLREVNKKAEFVDFNNKKALSTKINDMLNTRYEPEMLRNSVEGFAAFKNYAKNLKYLVESR